MSMLRTALLTTTPQALWNWGRLVLGGLFGLLLLILILLIHQAPRALLLFPLILVGGLAVGYLVRRPHLHLFLVTAGFIFITDYSEAIQPQEVLYGLYFISYLGSWFVYHVLLCRERICRSPGDRALLLFLVYATFTFGMTLMMGGDLHVAFREWLPLIYLAFYFPLKEACRRDPRAFKLLLLAFGIIALYTVLRNFHTYYTGLQSAEQIWQILSGRERLNERFFLVGSLGMLALFLYTTRPYQRTLLLMGSAVLLAGVIITQSRSLWVGYVLAGGIIFWMVDTRRRTQLAFLSVGGLLGLGIVAFALLDDFFLLVIGGLMDRMASLQSATSQDISLINRFIEWEAAWQQIKQSPILGNGFGVPYHYFSLATENTVVKSHIHNTFVELIYRHGLVGLGLFLAFSLHSYLTGIRLFRSSSTPPLYRAAAVTSVASMVAVSLAAMTESLMLSDDGTFVIAFLAAIMVGPWQRFRPEPSNEV